MKRWTAMLLSLSLIIGLSACGQQAVPSSSVSSQPSSIVVKEPEAPPPVSTSSPEEESEPVPDTAPAEPEGAAEEHILIAYFTWAENTEAAHPEEVDIDATTSASVLLPGNAAKLARWIHQRVGGDLFSIIVTEPYSSDYDECLDRAADEKAANARPALVNHLENMEDYDIIFLGFPNWWYTLPMAIHSFLEEYDFSGKTVIPFCTHGTGGLAGTIRDLTAALPDSATVLEPIGVYRRRWIPPRERSISGWTALALIKHPRKGRQRKARRRKLLPERDGSALWRKGKRSTGLFTTSLRPTTCGNRCRWSYPLRTTTGRRRSPICPRP